jgi:hypothetical protein
VPGISGCPVANAGHRGPAPHRRAGAASDC